MSRRLATLHELQTVLGLQDLYDLLEIAAVDAHNEAEGMRVVEREQQRAPRSR